MSLFFQLWVAASPVFGLRFNATNFLSVRNDSQTASSDLYKNSDKIWTMSVNPDSSDRVPESKDFKMIMTEWIFRTFKLGYEHEIRYKCDFLNLVQFACLM